MNYIKITCWIFYFLEGLVLWLLFIFAGKISIGDIFSWCRVRFCCFVRIIMVFVSEKSAKDRLKTNQLKTPTKTDNLKEGRSAGLFFLVLISRKQYYSMYVLGHNWLLECIAKQTDLSLLRSNILMWTDGFTPMYFSQTSYFNGWAGFDHFYVSEIFLWECAINKLSSYKQDNIPQMDQSCFSIKL